MDRYKYNNNLSNKLNLVLFTSINSNIKIKNDPIPYLLTNYSEIEAFFELKLEFIVYAISFLVCFNYWNYNNNIFNLVNKIDSKVIWLDGASLFILSLIPFLTTFVGMNFNSFIPNFLYGLDFLIVAILSMMSAEALMNSDKANVALQLALGNNKIYLSTIVLVICGMFIGYFVYPPAVLISCLLSIIVIWIIPHIHKTF